MVQVQEQEIPLAMAAMKLARSWHAAYRLILIGELEGRQKENGRWYVTIPSVDLFLSRPKEAA